MDFVMLNTSSHQKVVEFVGSDKIVLDIGAGSGVVSKQFVKNGCKVTVLELDPERAKQCRPFCQKVLIRNIEDLNFKFDKKFDRIVFGDVLEHLMDPVKVLRHVSNNYLAKDGSIIISMPNIANWHIRLNLLFGKFNYTKDGILDRTHLHFYTLETTKALLDSCGLKIKQIYYVPSVPFPFFKKHLAKLNRGAFSFQFVMEVVKK